MSIRTLHILIIISLFLCLTLKAIAQNDTITHIYHIVDVVEAKIPSYYLKFDTSIIYIDTSFSVDKRWIKRIKLIKNAKQADKYGINEQEASVILFIKRKYFFIKDLLKNK
jgi:hypothetical protein